MSTEVPYISGDFTEAAPVSLPEFSAPFPGVTEHYVLNQKWMQLESRWFPGRFNTEHPEFVDYILVEEGPLEDKGAGIVEWTRTYARVPQAYNEPGSYSYNFIGFFGVVNATTTITGRDRFTRTVPAKIQRDFFLVDDGIGNPAGPIFLDWTQIPVIEALRYYWSIIPELDVDFLADVPPFTLPTTPSRTAYESLIGTFIVVENSRISRWKGNIFQRETLYVKAQ